MSDKTRSMWAAIYSELSSAKPGLLGAVVARAEAQTIRLALIYALLDGSNQIDLPQLEAALAVWEYCEASAAHIFGNLIGDFIADEILCALHRSPDGLSRNTIRDLFSVPRRGLARTEAAIYLGISPSKFDELVKDGRMPGPRIIDARKLWDVYELDMAFDKLPH